MPTVLWKQPNQTFSVHVLTYFSQFYCQNNQTSTFSHFFMKSASLSALMFLWGWAAKRGGQRNWRIRMKRCESPLRNRKYGTYVKFSGSVRTEGNRGKTVPSRNSQSGWYNRRAGWYIRRFYNGKIRFRPKMANISGWMIYPVDDITEVYCIKNRNVNKKGAAVAADKWLCWQILHKFNCYQYN